MSRCVPYLPSLPSLLIALAASAPLAAHAQADLPRPFPQNALRGTVVFGIPPVLALNGDTARLSPAGRIRDFDNMIVMSATAYDRAPGKKYTVNYVLDMEGNVQTIWLLRPEEIKNKPWPTTAAEAARWSFDPAAQKWTKP